MDEHAGRAMRLPWKTVAAGAAGNVLEWYDFAVYGFFATVFAKVFFPLSSPFVGLLSAFAVFAASFLMRPLGAVVFGTLGDRLGRSRALVLSAGLMTASTVSIGLLPSFDMVGIAAPVLLLLMRLVQGGCIGGEYTTSAVFLAEHAAPGRRGFATSFSAAGVSGGTLIGSGVAAIVAGTLSSDQLLAWGWRVPFLLGVVLGLLSLYLRRTALQETPPVSDGRLPLLDTLRHDLPDLVRAVILSFQAGVAYYLLFVYLATYLQQQDGLSVSFTLRLNTVCLAVTMVLVPICAIISDKVGRRLVVLIGMAGLTLLTWPLFTLFGRDDIRLVISGQIALAMLLPLANAPLAALLVEMFPRRRRCSAVAFAWNLGVGIGGGTAPMVATYLVGDLSNKMAPALYLAVVSGIAALAVMTVKDRHLGPLDPDPTQPASRRAG
ncbi:MFS transporter [Aquabacter sp. P-9]|uniref:MFS transporter n=1 Tax=Aquabacter sediminis TaxID=3029197 RepID=UPI00237ED8C1|nr:MFS transporter [Aquabacter sp. P-9]MDE1570767.1 MFS transporter [Aquabacter sp. P-9]